MLWTQPSRIGNLIHACFPLKYPHFAVIQTRAFTTRLLNLCKRPEQLRQIHARFILHGLHQNPTLAAKLIDSYANLGLFSLPKRIFGSISSPSAVLYNTILRVLTQFGEFETTLMVYRKMVIESMYPDGEAYPFVLGSCSRLLDVLSEKIVHGHIVKLGLESCLSVGAALLDICGSSGVVFENAGEVVERMPARGLDEWNSMIFGASRNGEAAESFRHYERMRMERIELHAVTMINLLRRSVDLGSLRAGRALHCVMFVGGFSEHLSVNTALLSMYSKLGGLYDARALFENMPEKDSVVWNLMISAYSQNGNPQESLALLRHMVKSGMRADLFTALPAILSARQLKSIRCGKEIHAFVIRNGLGYQVSVHNSLIDMYGECDCLSYAWNIFDSEESKTVVSWSSMIKGYVNHDQSLEALSLFSKMKLDGPRVDFITVINILPACVNIGALEQVKYLHGSSVKFGLNMLSSVNTALLVSYAKCGCIETAKKLFDEENVSKDIITWNSMINAYAQHGEWGQCFKLYVQMKQLNLEPDRITFLGLLTACVNSGLVEEGWEIFKEMTETCSFPPNQEHYACMVDLLGRAGRLDEARELVKSIPFKPDTRVWGPLLSACKMHSATKLAEFAAENLMTIEPRNPGNYVLLSNIYAAAGKWDDVGRMRSLLKNRGLKKIPGCSWIEINGCVHEFRVANHSHPETHNIHVILRVLELEIGDARRKSERIYFNSEFVDFWQIT